MDLRGISYFQTSPWTIMDPWTLLLAAPTNCWANGWCCLMIHHPAPCQCENDRPFLTCLSVNSHLQWDHLHSFNFIYSSVKKPENLKSVEITLFRKKIKIDHLYIQCAELDARRGTMGGHHNLPSASHEGDWGLESKRSNVLSVIPLAWAQVQFHLITSFVPRILGILSRCMGVVTRTMMQSTTPTAPTSNRFAGS